MEADTGRAACRALDALRVFEDLPWAADGDWCLSCEALVPFSER